MKSERERKYRLGDDTSYAGEAKSRNSAHDRLDGPPQRIPGIRISALRSCLRVSRSRSESPWIATDPAESLAEFRHYLVDVKTDPITDETARSIPGFAELFRKV